MSESDKAFDYKVDRLLESDHRYKRESFYFIKDAIAFSHEIHTRKSRPKKHISVSQLADSIRVFALCEYGPMAKAVLEFWGIRSTADFGSLIFLLAGAGELELRPSDTRDKFEDLYSFDRAFDSPFAPQVPLVEVPILDEE